MTLKTIGPHPDHVAVLFAFLSLILPPFFHMFQDALTACLRVDSRDRDGSGQQNDNEALTETFLTLFFFFFFFLKDCVQA